MSLDDFTSALDDPTVGIVHRIDDDDETVLVACGGINLRPENKVGIMPFEFLRTVADLPVGKIFVRDLDQAFYHRGVRGAGDTIPEVGETIAGLIGDRRAVLVGASSGGYLALIVGALLGARSSVVAASPQTYLGRVRRFVTRDHRWASEVASLHRSSTRSRSLLDLRSPLVASPPGRAEVYFGDRNRLDALHARRLTGIPAVHLHPLPIAGHGTAQYLRDEGLLQSILARAIGPGH